MNRVVFKSVKQDWETPKDVYEDLDAEFQFIFDPCPPHPEFGNHGLLIRWNSPAFCNPPYKEISEWVKKAYHEWEFYNVTSVLLIPSRTDTRWWHDYVMKASEIRFIKGRLRFGRAKINAPFPSAVVVFQKKTLQEPENKIQ